MNSADSDSNDGHLGPRSDREWRRQYGPAIGAEVVQRLPCGWRRGCRSLRAKLCFDRGNVFQYWRTKLEEACVSCFAPQIPAWNDSDGEALTLVFAQGHGAELEAWQTRSHREDSSLFGRWWSSAFRLTTPIFVARGPALLFGISRWLSQHGISRKRRNNLTRVLIAVERSTQESKANSSHPSSREGHRCAGLSLRQFGVRRSDCRRHFPCPAELGSITPHAMHNGLKEPTAVAKVGGTAWVTKGQLSHLFNAKANGPPSLPFEIVPVAVDGRDADLIAIHGDAIERATSLYHQEVLSTDEP